MQRTSGCGRPRYTGASIVVCIILEEELVVEYEKLQRRPQHGSTRIFCQILLGQRDGKECTYKTKEDREEPRKERAGNDREQRADLACIQLKDLKLGTAIPLAFSTVSEFLECSECRQVHCSGSNCKLD